MNSDDNRRKPGAPGFGGAQPPPSQRPSQGPQSGELEAKPAAPGQGLLPSVALPKGGGAIRGIGEKFSTNPATGTGSLSVPIATSPGRAGFELSLELSYDSGAGNGPFGIGWRLSTPAITRKTDKGLPRYLDAEESDTFVLSGAEDLVPVPAFDSSGNEVEVLNRGNHSVKRYRPRVEGLFARIEQWTDKRSGEIHWRATTRDNVTNIYGQSPLARIADPEAPEAGRDARIFSWLLEETRDDRGNAARYSYIGEDGAGVKPQNAGESHRFDGVPGIDSALLTTAQRYLKRIHYGNRVPLAKGDPAPDNPEAWLFEVVFDYGEHVAPLEEDHHADTAPDPVVAQVWPVRPDAFSSYRSGFEVRTYRLCRRVLMFHRFPEEEERLGVTPCLVRSTDFTYDEGPVVTYLTAVTQAGYKWDEANAHYERATLPSLDLDYIRPELHDELRSIDRESLAGIPSGVDGSFHQWVDLDGEGIPGVLTAQERTWYYKRNKGGGQLAPPAELQTLPSPAKLKGGAQLTDLAGDGQLDLVSYGQPLPGYFARTANGDWEPFVEFRAVPNIDWNDPNLRSTDVDGDGHPDVLIAEDRAFRWYRSRAKEGFDRAQSEPKARDERYGPAVSFADGTGSTFLVDMSGDGLTDIVRIRSGEVCYWPNLGYARFGRKVTMALSEPFDARWDFDPARLRFGDIDGSGTTDIVYIKPDGVHIWANESGNGLRKVPGRDANGEDLDRGAPTLQIPDPTARIDFVDLLGQGTPCLVWSSAKPKDLARPLRYIDVMGGKKPHLLTSIVNNLGAETRIAYAPSTKFYLADREAGKPWLTRLAFPVQLVERIERYDYINESRLVTRFAYHHGYFDGHEREFRGFACVEQWDAESFGGEKGKGLFPEIPYDVDPADEALNLPPVRTVTWFHTGAWLERERLERELAKEYYDKDPEAPLLVDTVLPRDLSVKEEREAARALKGKILRQEIYAEDETLESERPYSVSERNYEIRLLKHADGDGHSVFFAHPRETINLHYERNLNDPRMQHELVLAVDEFGNVTDSAAIAYPRRTPMEPEQERLWATLTQATFINKADETDWHRVGVPVENVTWELTGLKAPDTPPGDLGYDERVESWRKYVNGVRCDIDQSTPVSYEQSPPDTVVTRRLIEAQRTRYYDDDLQPLPVGKTGSMTLQYEAFRLALTEGLVTGILEHEIDGQEIRVDQQWLRDEGHYLPGLEIPVDPTYRDDNSLLPEELLSPSWWAASGHVVYDNVSQAAQRFYLPENAQDPFGEEHVVDYDEFALLIREARDPIGNTAKTDNDYRVLAPWRLLDPNKNRIAIAFDALGMVVKTAVMGKEGAGEGDTLDDPTTALEYDLHRWVQDGKPAFVKTRMREGHDPANPRWQESYSYSDGSGREIMRKIQAEPGPVPILGADGRLERDPDGSPKTRHADDRWVGTGRTVLDNNKGKPVKKYEPFFWDSADFNDEKELVEWGVTTILRYDPLGRLIRIDQPNGAFSRVEFDAWSQASWDENDAVLESEWYTNRGSPSPSGPKPTAPPGTTDQDVLRETAEKRAAWLAAKHAGTPAVTLLDSLGRVFLNIAHNRIERSGSTADEKYDTRIELDIEGNERSVTDARVVVVLRQDFDVLGRVLHSRSPDAGDRWTLLDAGDKPARSWDSRKHAFRTMYDELQRPTHFFVSEEGKAEKLVQRTVYGDAPGTPGVSKNLRGQVYRDYDGAGVVTNVEFDFKGNLKESNRRLKQAHREVADWSTLGSPTMTVGDMAAAADALLLSEPFTMRTEYDALNRIISRTSPDGSESRPTYNEANLLDKVEVRLRGSSTSTTFIKNIDYNTRGQRLLVEYGNGTRTNYNYDEQTFRLTQLVTLRGTNERLQDLAYTYDPVGNITEIADGAQQTIFFGGAVVKPKGRYRYDALYQLIEAEGREHPGQQPTHQDPPRAALPHPNDGQALRRYTERYFYDAVGNIERMAHDAGTSGWTGFYGYEEGTGAKPKSNRLQATSAAGDDAAGPYSAKYEHDAHGNMTRMPHLAKMRWDHADRLVGVDLGGGGDAYYSYNASGDRVRKVVEKGGVVEERLYFGGYEIFRKRSGTTLDFVRQTLHVMDDQRRVALVETKTRENGTDVISPTPRQRYQLDNHLGSSLLELDKDGQVISYEEYFPFGGTAVRMVQRGGPYSWVEASPKRYRYNGKERDEETSLYYYGARYYAAWLRRWTTIDPAGFGDGPNRYIYAGNNPVLFVDEGGKGGKIPRLFGNWLVGRKVPNKGKLGKRVEVDHPNQVQLRKKQRTRPDGVEEFNRATSKKSRQIGVLLETGKGEFHTELGKRQSQITKDVLEGKIQHESDLMHATRQAYRDTAKQLKHDLSKEDLQAIDTALLSDQATLHKSASGTRKELSKLQATIVGAATTFLVEGKKALAATEENPQSRDIRSEAKENLGKIARIGGDLGETGDIGALGVIGAALSNLATTKSIERAELHNLNAFSGRLKRVDNLMAMVDPRTGDVYRINLNFKPESITKMGELTEGLYLSGKTLIYQSEKGPWTSYNYDN